VASVGPKGAFGAGGKGFKAGLEKSLKNKGLLTVNATMAARALKRHLLKYKRNTLKRRGKRAEFSPGTFREIRVT